jgi:hypothetical protein
VIEIKLLFTYADLHCRIVNVNVTRNGSNSPYKDGAYHNVVECVIKNHSMQIVFTKRSQRSI